MGTLTETQLAAKFKAGGRNWDQLCQAFVRQAAAWTGGAPTPNYLSAIAAYHASKIESKDASKAPLGAVHYWDIGTYGHVAFQVGGGKIAMGSKYVTKRWGNNCGTTTVAAYTRTTGARYLGWARSNGHNTIKVGAPAPPTPARPAAGRKYTTARAGEGFIKIAARMSVSVATLERLNPKADPSGLLLGQRIYYA